MEGTRLARKVSLYLEFVSSRKTVMTPVKKAARKKVSSRKRAAPKKAASKKKAAPKKVTAKKSSSKKAADPCWDGYERVGSKKKAGKTVPNCVPEKS